jgi:hypothetical protein
VEWVTVVRGSLNGTGEKIKRKQSKEAEAEPPPDKLPHAPKPQKYNKNKIDGDSPREIPITPSRIHQLASVLGSFDGRE